MIIFAAQPDACEMRAYLARPAGERAQRHWPNVVCNQSSVKLVRFTLIWSNNLKLTGLTQNLTQNLGQLEGPYRDFQSNCWVNLRILGQPCEFYLYPYILVGARSMVMLAKWQYDPRLRWPRGCRPVHSVPRGMAG